MLPSVGDKTLYVRLPVPYRPQNDEELPFFVRCSSPAVRVVSLIRKGSAFVTLQDNHANLLSA
jgi:hypothetical protein